MLITTTPSVKGREIDTSLGLVTGMMVKSGGYNAVRDKHLTPDAYDKNFAGAVRDAAIEDMTERAKALDANAIVGVSLSYEVLDRGNFGVTLMVSTSGTAVKLS